MTDYGVLARSIRANPIYSRTNVGVRRGQRTLQPAECFVGLFFHSRDVLAMLMHSVTMQRRTNAQEKLEGITEIVSVVAIETIGTIVDCELGAESDVEPVAVRQIADVTDRVTAHGKDP